MAQRDSGAELVSWLTAIQGSDELRQSLAAASNYVGAARLLLSSNNSASTGKAIESLDKAEAQILRAGDIIRRLDRAAQRAKGSPSSGVQ
jgi:phosphoglycerate-specific signal transduction histidine kinase